MYQGKSEIAKPRNKNIYRGPSRRPKGMGRRNPHSSEHTRKLKGRHTQYDKTALAISNGLDKISLFFTGKPHMEKVKAPVSSNPFAGLINKLLTFNKKDK